MKKKLIAYGLIVLGALPILSTILFKVLYNGTKETANILPKLGNGFIFIAYFVGAILMIIGFYLLKKENFRMKSEAAEQNLNEGEEIIFKQVGGVSILTITNQRIIFYGFYVDGMRKSIANLPSSNKTEYQIKDIAGVKPINSGEFSENKQLVSAKWGIQILFKDGKVVNIPISGQDMVAQNIDRLVKQKSW